MLVLFCGRPESEHNTKLEKKARGGDWDATVWQTRNIWKFGNLQRYSRFVGGSAEERRCA
ncbi:hypothetical protein H9L39_18763 [Fusarium oxysporum f. sp. albedinis]|nr:hypothetical protein H9L39_18763 [Fusarium oxysporum f. sp. albedinis]